MPQPTMPTRPPMQARILTSFFDAEASRVLALVLCLVLCLLLRLSRFGPTRSELSRFALFRSSPTVPYSDRIRPHRVFMLCL